MIILHPLFNPIDILNLLTKDNIYKDCFKTDDIYHEHIDFKHHLWFELILDNHSIGILWLTDFSHNCVTFHGGLFKKYRNKCSAELLTEVLQQLKDDNSHITFITTILKTNIKAIRLIEEVGYRPIMTIIKDNLIVYGDNEVISHG